MASRQHHTGVTLKLQRRTRSCCLLPHLLLLVTLLLCSSRNAERMCYCQRARAQQHISAAAAATTEAQILLAFKSGVVDNPQLHDWQVTDGSASSPCTWTGVGCNNSSQVVSLDLSDRALQGTISPLLGSLRSLSVLNLARNQFRGLCPRSWVTPRRWYPSTSPAIFYQVRFPRP